jgi:hypothetical protein
MLQEPPTLAEAESIQIDNFAALLVPYRLICGWRKLPKTFAERGFDRHCSCLPECEIRLDKLNVFLEGEKLNGHLSTCQLSIP